MNIMGRTRTSVKHVNKSSCAILRSILKSPKILECFSEGTTDFIGRLKEVDFVDEIDLVDGWFCCGVLFFCDDMFLSIYIIQ